MANLRYKNLLRETTRHGKEVWYVRVKVDGKFKRTRLHEEPGSAAFIEEYNEALEGFNSPKAAELPKRYNRYSIGWLCAKYYASPDFQDGAPATQKQRRNILNRICEKSGHKDCRTLTSKDVKRGRDARRKTPGAANNFLKALKALYVFAIEEEFVETNPVVGVKRLKLAAGGFKTWTVGDCKKFEDKHPVGTPARLAYALALYAGLRRSDIITLGKQHITGDGFLRFKQAKQGNQAKEIHILILPELQQAIDAYASTGLHFLNNAYGKPYTHAAFGNRMRAWCAEAGLESGLSAHGLRKALGARLADAGLSEHQIAAVLGHRGTATVKIYTAGADQKRLAEEALRTLGEQRVAPGATFSKSGATKSR